MQINKDEIQIAIESELIAGEKKYGKDFKICVLKILSLEKMLHPEPEKKRSRIIPLSKWNEYHNYPTVGALRQLYFKRESNGFDYCVERGGLNGGTVLINEDKYFEWKDNRNKIKAS